MHGAACQTKRGPRHMHVLAPPTSGYGDRAPASGDARPMPVAARASRSRFAACATPHYDALRVDAGGAHAVTRGFDETDAGVTRYYAWRPPAPKIRRSRKRCSLRPFALPAHRALCIHNSTRRARPRSASLGCKRCRARRLCHPPHPSRSQRSRCRDTRGSASRVCRLPGPVRHQQRATREQHCHTKACAVSASRAD
ncbi:hypothetical protein C8Q79DRAFT_638930 [Trametes meyenii]|nr:hypothetical protein C8Q79DRAFT_638930 [Trametes meyenii]